MNGYKVEILETNIDDKIQKIRIKNFSDATTLIEGLVLKIVKYAILKVENPYSKQEKEYIKYVFLDDEGNLYVTGSESFWSSFKDIFDELDSEVITYTVKSKESKNYAGKFIYCAPLI